MRRALPSTLALLLALFLAAGIGFVGPALVRPEPVDPMAGTTAVTLTAVSVTTMPSSPLPGSDRVQPITTNRTTERTISCNTSPTT